MFSREGKLCYWRRKRRFSGATWCISYLLLHNKSSPNLPVSNNRCWLLRFMWPRDLLWLNECEKWGASFLVRNFQSQCVLVMLYVPRWGHQGNRSIWNLSAWIFTIPQTSQVRVKINLCCVKPLRWKVCRLLPLTLAYPNWRICILVVKIRNWHSHGFPLKLLKSYPKTTAVPLKTGECLCAFQVLKQNSIDWLAYK